MSGYYILQLSVLKLISQAAVVRKGAINNLFCTAGGLTVTPEGINVPPSYRIKEGGGVHLQTRLHVYLRLLFVKFSRHIICFKMIEHF